MLTSPWFWTWPHSVQQRARYLTTYAQLQRTFICSLACQHSWDFLYFWLIIFLIPTLLEPGSWWACPLQSVWDCGAQRLHARGALHGIRQSPPSPEENRAAPQKPVRSGFSCLKHCLACCVCSWKLTVFCGGIIFLRMSLFAVIVNVCDVQALCFLPPPP